MKHFNLNKKTNAILLSCALATASLSGCARKEKPTLTLVESIQANNDFDLFHDEDMVIINTINAMKEENIKFAEKISLDKLTMPQDSYSSKFKNLEEYHKYFITGYPPRNTILYFDALNGELLSIKYIDRENHIFKDNEITTTYRISEIAEEESAYNYAVLYFGDKENYTREEMEELVNFVKENKNKKPYSKVKKP